jgi:hypothetical protein
MNTMADLLGAMWLISPLGLAISATAADWEDVERSPLNTTLPGVGSHG